MVNNATKPLGRQDEIALITHARRGDSRALRQLVDTHKDRLYAFIFRVLANHHDTEEVCQEAFLKAFAALDSFSTKYRFSTWLFTIAYRVSLNFLRRKRALTGEVDFASLPRDDAGPVDDAVRSESAELLRRTVWSAVDNLSTPQRVAVLLFYRHDQSCQEIAGVLNVPVATVKSHLHRARARLREMLEPQVAEDFESHCDLKIAAG